MAEEMTSEERLKAVLAKVNELAVLPHVVFKVLEISGNSDFSGIEMERAILVDPGFCSKVLTLANSAAFGLPRKVTVIKEAIAFLGFRAVRNVAMTVGIFDLFVGKTDKESLRRRAWWRHSIDTAIMARWLSKDARQGNPDEAYTCGLLHLIGKTLLDRTGLGDYSDVEAKVEAGMSDLEAETEVYGANFVDVGRGAGIKWGLPAPLIDGLQCRYAPDPASEFAALRAITALAAYFAKVARDGWKQDESVESAPLWAMEILGIEEDRLEQVVLSASSVLAQSSQNPAA